MHVLRTPVGEIGVFQTESGETQALWLDPDAVEQVPQQADVGDDVIDRLGSYFAGSNVSFDDVPTPAGSQFYARCWETCRQIPAGRTISYSELAERAGSPRAARAAGQAMRNNPLPVIIPCHRVVGSDGKLHGYAGTTDRASDSLRRKRWLLDLERQMAEKP